MAVHYKYCPECGEKLRDKNAGDDGPVPYCGQCGQFWFDGFPSCVIVLTYNNKNEMIVTRQDHISMVNYALTSGFIVPGETAEEAAVRELGEELGLTVKELTYDKTYWYARKGMLMHAFFALTEDSTITRSEEVQGAWWIPAEKGMDYWGEDRPGRTDVTMWRRFCAWRGIVPEGDKQ